MPIHDYRCSDCGQTSELLVRTSDGPGPRCSHCGGGSLERLVSAPHLLHQSSTGGLTCCGREERCESPPCSQGSSCRRG